MCFYGCEDDEVRQVHENCYDEFITLEEGVWFRFSWIKNSFEHLRSGGDAHVHVTVTGVQRSKFVLSLLQRTSCDSVPRGGGGWWWWWYVGCDEFKRRGFRSYYKVSTCSCRQFSSECLSSGCDGCLLSSTCLLSDEWTGISSVLSWIALELH